MPPNLDLYVISSARNQATIEDFLDSFVDREASEDRGDEQLMMLPLGATDPPPKTGDWNWESSRTLSNIIERGLQSPHRAFSVALRSRDTSLCGVWLGFTTDDRVVFGLSIDDEGVKPENLAKAKLLLHRIIDGMQGERGFIGVEMPVPLTPRMWHPDRVIYDWSASML